MDTCAEILKAAADGNLHLLEQLAAADPQGFREKCERVRDFEGLSALHLAAAAGNTQICKYLIEIVKVNINVKTEKGETPLFLATQMANLRTATFLTRHGADVNEGNFKGKTALHCASENGHKNFMQLLISRGADIQAIYECGPIYEYKMPMQAAANFGKLEAVRILLDHNANPNSAPPFSLTPVMLSVRAHSIECLELLLKAGADPNLSSCGITPLARAALEEETQYLKLLLKAGANPNGVDLASWTPVEHAALARNLAGVELLFPLTSRIPSIPDWSFHGIISYINSKEGKEQRELKRKENFLLLKKRGKTAVKRTDFMSALSCYTQALFLFPNDATMLSNRSLCWARLNDGNHALRDAETCVELRPDWAKAHYREGAAWTLLKNYSMASEAFFKAQELDPENKEIHKAFKEAVEAEFGMEVSDNIRAIKIIL